MLRDEKEDAGARLKAVDLLNKMDGLYVQKHDAVSKLDVEAIVEASWKVNPNASSSRPGFLK